MITCQNRIALLLEGARCNLKHGDRLSPRDKKQIARDIATSDQKCKYTEDAFYTFKRIFGNDKAHDILISFLDAIMGLTGDRSIESVVILNPYEAPKIKELKHSFLWTFAAERAK